MNYLISYYQPIKQDAFVDRVSGMWTCKVELIKQEGVSVQLKGDKTANFEKVCSYVYRVLSIKQLSFIKKVNLLVCYCVVYFCHL